MAKVELKSARTSEKDPVKAAEELCNALGGATPKLVTIFGSSDRDQVALNRALRERLPRGTRVIGATTCGEIDNAGMHMGTVVMSALTGDLEIGIGLEGREADGERGVGAPLAGAERRGADCNAGLAGGSPAGDLPRD